MRLSTSSRPPSVVGARPAPPRSAARARRQWLLPLAIAVTLGGIAYVAIDLWSRRTPELTPRHRAEALCFLLAEPPPFDPPMRVQPSSALVRGRFMAGAPASFALQQLMHFEQHHILRQWLRHVGDYDVAAQWLRLPGAENEHWLVVAWMEDADLAVCNFRFTGEARMLSAEERAWGKKLLDRVLVPENFERGALPAARLRVSGGATMPSFGPAAS